MEKKQVKITDDMELNLDLLTKEEIEEKGYMTAHALENEFNLTKGLIKKSVANKKIEPVGVNNRGYLYYNKYDIEKFVANRSSDNTTKSFDDTLKEEQKEIANKVTKEEIEKERAEMPVITEEEMQECRDIVKKYTPKEQKDVQIFVYISYALLTLYLLFNLVFGLSRWHWYGSFALFTISILNSMTYIASVVLMLIARCKNSKDKAAKVCMWVHIVYLILSVFGGVLWFIWSVLMHVLLQFGFFFR